MAEDEELQHKRADDRGVEELGEPEDGIFKIKY